MKQQTKNHISAHPLELVFSFQCRPSAEGNDGSRIESEAKAALFFQARRQFQAMMPYSFGLFLLVTSHSLSREEALTQLRVYASAIDAIVLDTIRQLPLPHAREG